MFLFEPQFVKTDVTSVKILKDYYLVGVGGYIHFFDKESYQLRLKINIFDGQKIYGISPDKLENKVLLYGGKYIKIISIDNTFTKIDKSQCKIAHDWILTAKWIDDYQQIVTVSMNNRLQIWSTSLELITEVKCEEKCILYSAYICYDKFKELVILSGTVFSEVLIWKPNEERDSLVLKRLQRHKGVIFSVHYNEASGNICSSSDDRSAVLWKPKTGSLLTELRKENIEIDIVCHVFGHLSRIFRCHSLKQCFLTAGEDSVLNIWSFDGTLIRKIETRQGGSIWTVDANETDNFILTGGSDCAVMLFPINCNFDERELLIPNREVPKTVGVLSNNNLVVFCENGVLYFYNGKAQEWLHIQEHNDLKNYALVVLSKCRNLVALSGFRGQIYIYKQENERLHQIISFETNTKSRIFALHWIDCSSFLICQAGGKITLYYIKDKCVVPISTFVLPPSKERWSTTAVFTGKNFVIGDRKGNLHIFEFGKSKAVQSLRKVHSHLGVTNSIVQNNRIMSLGRNAMIKTFLLNDDDLQLTSSDKLPFTWLVDIIRDVLLAFSGDKFILWDLKAKRVIFEKSCGGGHRSWDFLQINNDASFYYIKDKIIHVVDLNVKNFSPVDLIEGYQVREINSVQAIKFSNSYVIVSGGEDTTLRVNLANGNQFSSIVSLKPHLSSIRTITMQRINQNSDKETYLVFSGGGRAQIICWKLEIYLERDSFRDIVCSQQHSYYKAIDNEESEMRIMYLTVTNIQSQLFLLAACSDGNIKVFSIVEDSGKYQLQFYRDIFYKLKCILKLDVLYILGCNILVTMATDGKLIFWDVSHIKTQREIKFFQSVQSHQSGINSYAFKIIKNDLCLCLTGGDDNSIVLNLFRFQPMGNISVETVDTFRDTGTHCAQITGVFLSDTYFLTASIDQRIAIFRWQLLDEKLVCEYITKYNTSIADVQGLCCFENYDFDAFVYGKGIENIKIKKKS